MTRAPPALDRGLAILPVGLLGVGVGLQPVLQVLYS